MLQTSFYGVFCELKFIILLFRTTIFSILRYHFVLQSEKDSLYYSVLKLHDFAFHF